MKEKAAPGFINNITEWKEPAPITSVNIDPTRYSHLLIYEDYCQVVVGHVTSPALDKSDAQIVLQELKGLLNSFGTTKSKLSAVRYTPTSIKVGSCTLLGKPGHNGFIEALKLYVTDGPYPKDEPYFIKIESGSELIVKERVFSGKLYAWWNIKHYTFGQSKLLNIVGPYESFSYGFNDSTFIDNLSEAVKCLIETDAREVKIDTGFEFLPEVNLRVFKQSICGEPAVCISTDIIMGNQRSLIFIGKESGIRFLKFLKKAKQALQK